jgi:hypothetical protein
LLRKAALILDYNQVSIYGPKEIWSLYAASMGDPHFPHLLDDCSGSFFLEFTGAGQRAGPASYRRGTHCHGDAQRADGGG